MESTFWMTAQQAENYTRKLSALSEKINAGPKCSCCGEPVEIKTDAWSHVSDASGWCYAGGELNKWFPVSAA